MSKNTVQRIVVALVMALVAAVAVVLEFYGIHAVKYLGIIVVAGMIAEMITCIVRTPAKTRNRVGNLLIFGCFLVWLVLMLCSVMAIGKRVWIILLLVVTICAADIGAWLFGKTFGGDKMWKRLSAHKTWSGQIAGIVCGTGAAILYGIIGVGYFMPQLLWIGISISLLSQYGDLTASWIKRRMGIKDFGTILPGHGGILDRFDGWIYVLPLVWLILM